MENAQQNMPEDNRPSKVVYTIVERGPQNGDKKKAWIRIGADWVNQDQSLNVKLDAAPTNGTLHIRDYQPYDGPRRRYAGDVLAGMGDMP